MSEDRETRPDEDVEAHTLKASAAKGATKARNDEGDDVEAHTLKASAAKGATKARNDEGDGDDVEGHMLKNQLKASNKA
jgi:hypothetical protein